jgi:hypothetical protein
MIPFIARIFNPLLSPLFAFTILIAVIPVSIQETEGLKLIHWLIACVFSSGLIFLYVIYLKYKRAIHTTELVEREHRMNPVTFAILSYALGYVFLTAFNAPAIVRALMLCYVTNSILVLIITRRWKISLHTTALGNAVMALVYYLGWMMIPAFGLIAIVAAGRVQTQKHDLLQVGAGALLGTAMTGLQFYFFGLKSGF